MPRELSQYAKKNKGSEVGDDALLRFVEDFLLEQGQDWIEGLAVKA